MGEMADFANEGGWDEEAYLEYHFGHHEDGDGPPIYSVTCRCCKKGGLTWSKHLGKWRLFNRDPRTLNPTTLHQCPVNPLTP